MIEVDHNSIIEELNAELQAVKAERDELKCENYKLKLQLEWLEKNISLQDENCVPITNYCQNTTTISNNEIDNNYALCRNHDEKNMTYKQHHTGVEDYSDQMSMANMDSQVLLNTPHDVTSNRNGKSNMTLCQNVTKSQILFKKASVRNADGTKRNRILNAYELSQYLLDKQIELLERKYGGDKARNAALTIQRAFRRYTLIKKFTYITTKAKQDKKYTEQKSTPRLPARSMSLRETNRTYFVNNTQDDTPADVNNANFELSNNVNHPHVNVLHFEHDLYVSDMRNELCGSRKKIPPEVPKRTSSISNRTGKPIVENRQIYDQIRLLNYDHGSPNSTLSRINCADNSMMRSTTSENSLVRSTMTDSKINTVQNYGGYSKFRSNLCEMSYCRPNFVENGSVCSVQSSGSDSSIHYDTYERGSASPIWKKIEQTSSNEYNLSSATPPSSDDSHSQLSHKTNETIRKRQYRVGLNLFNKKPDKGVQYLIQKQFLENSSYAIAKFLITRKGISKKIIGEFLGDLQNPLSQKVLEDFSNHLDFTNMELDVALRKFMSFFRIPGEAQKIEKIIEVFSKRFMACNYEMVDKFQNADTIFILSFAIIMLNTDLHTPNLKPEKRMKLDDFVKNLRNIDNGRSIDRDLLAGIYERVKVNEFKCSSDHVTQVMKVQQTIVGKKPNLALTHRRLVCYCRLYEIPDLNKKERIGVHQREVFLFNDLLVITKILSKKKNCVSYTFRQSLPLNGINVGLFETTHYPFGIRLSQRVDGKVLITFNARNEHDRIKFADDLKESILEMNEMENIRIENELDRQKRNNRNEPNRDSGVADLCSCQVSAGQFPGHTNSVCSCSSPAVPTGSLNSYNMQPNHNEQLKRSALSNSLLDMNEQSCETLKQRRGSVGSLDSGMGLSFTTNSHRHQSQQQYNVQYSQASQNYQQQPYSNLQQQTNSLQQNLLHTLHTIPYTCNINVSPQPQSLQQDNKIPLQYQHQITLQHLQMQQCELMHQQNSVQKRERKLSRSTEV